MPTAVLVTEHDTVVPPRRQRALAAAIKGSVVYPVAGDHGVCALDPGAFVPVLEQACLAVTARQPARGRQGG